MKERLLRVWPAGLSGEIFEHSVACRRFLGR